MDMRSCVVSNALTKIVVILKMFVYVDCPMNKIRDVSNVGVKDVHLI